MPEDKDKDSVPAGATAGDGQTAAGSGELGNKGDAEFAKPVTTASTIGQTSPTNTLKATEEEKPDVPSSLAAAAKALGLRKSSILSFNERTRVFVTEDGGKYQLSTKGRAIRHLAGPAPSLPEDSKLNYVDARSRSPFVGTAAAINASVHEEPNTNLIQQRARLERQLAEVNSQIDSRS